MLTTQVQGGLAHLDRIGVGQAPGWLIIGPQRVGSAVSEPLEQMADGAWGQVESAGEAGGVLAGLGAFPEFLPDRERDRFRHGQDLRAGIRTVRTTPIIFESAPYGKT